MTNEPDDTPADPPAADTTDAKARPSVLRTREDIRDAIAATVGLGRREIVVFAPQLDAFFYNGSQLGRSLASFAASHQQNRARILVEDAGQVLRDNDRLVTICRRMSEFIQLREVAEQHRGLREMFVIVDGGSYLHQIDVTEPECVVDPFGRQKAALLRQRFNSMWERSEPLTGLYTPGLSS
jgi:hypothetical protein